MPVRRLRGSTNAAALAREDLGRVRSALAEATARRDTRTQTSVQGVQRNAPRAADTARGAHPDRKGTPVRQTHTLTHTAAEAAEARDAILGFLHVDTNPVVRDHALDNPPTLQRIVHHAGLDYGLMWDAMCELVDEGIVDRMGLGTEHRYQLMELTAPASLVIPTVAA